MALPVSGQTPRQSASGRPRGRPSEHVGPRSTNGKQHNDSYHPEIGPLKSPSMLWPATSRSQKILKSLGSFRVCLRHHIQTPSPSLETPCSFQPATFLPNLLIDPVVLLRPSCLVLTGNPRPCMTRFWMLIS